MLKILLRKLLGSDKPGVYHLEFDNEDVVEINGLRFSGELMRAIGGDFADLQHLFYFNKEMDGVVTVHAVYNLDGAKEFFNRSGGPIMHEGGRSPSWVNAPAPSTGIEVKE